MAANQATGQEAGAVYVSVMPSGQGFSKNMDRELIGAFDSAQRSGTSSFGRFFTRVAAAGASILAAIGLGRLVKNTVDLGLSYNVLEQSSKAAFTTLLGSAEAAADLQSQIREFAKTSPFPRQAFIEGTQQLLAFGFAAEDIIPTLGAVQDAVAAAGGSSEDLAQIIDVFASIRSQGKITTDDLNRLALSGVNGFEILASAAGVSGDEIRKRISSGAIDADTAIAQLTAGMEARFGGAADGLKSTWVGAVDRIKGAYRDLSSALVAPFVDPNGGGYAVEWANKFADLLRQIEGSAAFDALTAKLSNFGEKLDPIVSKTFALLGLLTEENGGAKFLDGLKDAAEGVPGLSTVLSIIEALSPLLPAVQGLISQIAPEIEKLAPAFTDLVEALIPLIPPLVDLTVELAPSLVTLALALVSVLVPLLELITWMGPGLAFIAEAIGWVLSFSSGFLGFWAGLIGLVQENKLNLESLFDLYMSIPGPLGDLVKAVGRITLGIANSVIDAINGIRGAIANVINGISSTLGIGAKITVGNIPRLRVPGLAESGTVLPRPDGTLIRVAEAGRAESVVDTGKLNDLMDAASGGGRGMPIVQIGTMVAADTDEAVRKIQQSQRRANSLAGIGSGVIA